MPDLIGTSGRVDIEQIDKDEWVNPQDATERGYWGYSPEGDRDQYTVAGVTKDLPGPSGTAQASDKPDPVAEKRVKANTEPLKGSKS